METPDDVEGNPAVVQFGYFDEFTGIDCTKSGYVETWKDITNLYISWLRGIGYIITDEDVLEYLKEKGASYANATKTSSK